MEKTSSDPGPWTGTLGRLGRAWALALAVRWGRHEMLPGGGSAGPEWTEAARGGVGAGWTSTHPRQLWPRWSDACSPKSLAPQCRPSSARSNIRQERKMGKTHGDKPARHTGPNRVQRRGESSSPADLGDLGADQTDRLTDEWLRARKGGAKSTPRWGGDPDPEKLPLRAVVTEDTETSRVFQRRPRTGSHDLDTEKSLEHNTNPRPENPPKSPREERHGEQNEN